MNARVTKPANTVKFARAHAPLWKTKLAKNATYSTLYTVNMLQKKYALRKNYALLLFRKERKIYKCLTYFTPSKVVKERLILFKSNHKN